MRISSIDTKNFLSFPSSSIFNDGQVPEFGDLNLLVGQNDSGKSNLIKAIIVISTLLNRWCSRDDSGMFSEHRFSNIDVLGFDDNSVPKLLFHNMVTSKPIEFEVEYELQDGTTVESFYAVPFLYGHIEDRTKTGHKAYLKVQGQISLADNWCSFSPSIVTFSNFTAESGKRSLHSRTVEEIKANKDSEEHLKLHGFLKKFADELKRLVFISPVRDAKSARFRDVIDKNNETLLRDQLHDLKEGSDAEFRRYELFEKFVIKLTSDGMRTNRRVVFPSSGGISLSNDKKVFPLSHYGSGVEQLIIMAGEIVAHGDYRAIFIEEPEVHFHPALQRSFLEYIQDSQKELNHQYFLLSHSPVFINSVIKNGGLVFLSQKTNISENETALSRIEIKGGKAILDELGAMGADLLQANGVIWVEGPSDRIYINKWLELYSQFNAQKLLQEGHDYSILFYGGSILKWFGADDEYLEEGEIEKDTEGFINLMKLNRNIAIVMDKDKREGEKWKSKNRIKSEVEKVGGLTWITDGCEIENYLTADLIYKINLPASNVLVTDYTPNANKQFADCFNEVASKSGKKQKTLYQSSKIEFANRITNKMEITDLRANVELLDRVGKLFGAIQVWNRPSYPT